MPKEDLLKRIVLDPTIMTGKPVLKGTRLTVQFIINLLANGASEQEIIEEYKISREDILACLMYASKNLEHTTVIPISKAI